MHIVYAYLLGILTPFTIWIIIGILSSISDWKQQRRYHRAWAKFSTEYDKLTPEDKLKFSREINPGDTQYGSERDRWFAKKWRYGDTTEV